MQTLAILPLDLSRLKLYLLNMASELNDDYTASGDGAAKLENRRILILYGSETGNSQDLAGDIERLAERLHFNTHVREMNDVELVS